jgi:hypothetical protein
LTVSTSFLLVIVDYFALQLIVSVQEAATALVCPLPNQAPTSVLSSPAYLPSMLEYKA